MTRKLHAIPVALLAMLAILIVGFCAFDKAVAVEGSGDLAPAELALQDGETQIDKVLINVERPSVGAKTTDADPAAIVPVGEGYTIESAFWLMDGGGVSTQTPDYTFAADQSYWMCVVLKADSGYAFKKGSANETHMVWADGYNYGGACSVFDGSCQYAVTTGDFLHAIITVQPKTASTSVAVIYGTYPKTIGGKVACDLRYGDGWQVSEPSSNNVSSSFNRTEVSQVRMKAEAEGGYHFIGWYEGVLTADGHSIYGNTGKLVSSSATYTFGTTAEAFGPDNLLALQAVFEEGAEPVVERTVSFAANGGSGSMASVKANDGSEYTLPACAFMAPSGKVFDRWDKGAVGAKITVTADTELKAQWKDAPKPDPEPEPQPGPSPDPQPVATQAMFRLYNPHSGEHFYTADENEKTYLSEIGWTYEGIGWTAPAESDRPVYRLYNRSAGDHHYTTDANEREYLIGIGWEDENVGWYSSDETGAPLYRQYNPNAKGAGSHNYTADENERDWLVNNGWNDEGIGWYGISAEA